MPTREYELGERIDELTVVTTDGDRCISVAVPPGEAVGETLERVEEDHADAEYLHTEGADRALVEALEHARHILHRYEADGTPEQGLALYVGVADGEVVEHVFDDLPHPVTERLYAVDNEFDVSPLEGVRSGSRTYGLLAVERGGAALGRLEGEDVEHVETVESNVMGKTRAGGQSAQRFARERERQKEEFFDEVAEEAKRAFLADGAATGDVTSDSADREPLIDGLLVGGTTVTVDDFLDGDYLDYRLEERLTGGSFSVEYATDQGLHQLVDRAEETLSAAEDRPAREALDTFFDAIESGEPTVYGREATEDALEYGAVETLLVAEGTDATDIRELEERAHEEGGDVVVIPEEFDRGAQFREGFGGVGAVLRFPVQ